MVELGKEIEPFYEEGRRHVLRPARFIGRTVVGLAQDIVDFGHERVGQERYDELKKAANVNSVSGCLTRRGMFRTLNKLLELEKPDQLLITYVDAVNFKRINDNFGQNTGDLALAMTGWGLRQIFRTDDEHDTDALVGAWGGDEFMCVLPADASMNEEAFSGSLEFNYQRKSNTGIVTWHFKDFLEGMNEATHSETASVFHNIENLVNRGVDSIGYRYTFDVVDVGWRDSAQNIIDRFAESNTVKTATYLRKPR